MCSAKKAFRCSLAVKRFDSAWPVIFWRDAVTKDPRETWPGRRSIGADMMFLLSVACHTPAPLTHLLQHDQNKEAGTTWEAKCTRRQLFCEQRVSLASHENMDSLAVLGETNTLWGITKPVFHYIGLHRNSYQIRAINMPHLCYAKNASWSYSKMPNSPLMSSSASGSYSLSESCEGSTHMWLGSSDSPGKFWRAGAKETRFRPSSTTEQVLCHGLLTGKRSVTYLAVAGLCETSRLYRFCGCTNTALPGFSFVPLQDARTNQSWTTSHGICISCENKYFCGDGFDSMHRRWPLWLWLYQHNRNTVHLTPCPGQMLRHPHTARPIRPRRSP